MVETASNFQLRSAREADYRFAEALYLLTMEPLLVENGAWSEERLIENLKISFKLEEVRIITVDGRDVGWLQVSETEQHFKLGQIHIERAFRSRGIGSQLIQELFDRAGAKSKPVLLSVVRSNPAVALYERLGFRIVDGDRDKFHMRWERSPSESENILDRELPETT